MARALLAASLLSSFVAAAPEAGGCSKKSSPQFDPQPVPVTSASAAATTPPIWAPPDTGGPLPSPPPSASTPPANPDLAKARTASAAGEHKKVRTLLEKKVRGGKGTSEEAALLMTSCIALKDKPCMDAVKAKHPELEPAPAP